MNFVVKIAIDKKSFETKSYLTEKSLYAGIKFVVNFFYTIDKILNLHRISY